MAADIPRLIAGCQRDLVRALIERFAPKRIPDVDWSIEGRVLGRDIARVIKSDPIAWPKLQNIESLAYHGGTAAIRSVLYDDGRLRNEFDELDGGSETAAVWLALRHDVLFEFALSALHADQGLNKRSWKAYKVALGKGVKFSFDMPARSAFEKLVKEAIRNCPRFDAPGELETHHFSRVIFPEHSHSRRLLDQVTVYAEARIVTEDVFVEERLETQVRRKVDSISVVFDRERRELDVVTIGGGKFILDVGNAFCEAFSGEAARLQPLVRRKINFNRFLNRFELRLQDQSRFVRAKVDEIRVFSPSGILMTFDAKSKRDSQEDVYDVAEADLGERSPFLNRGWSIISARIVLFATPSRLGRKSRPRAIDLKPNGHTNLLEQDDTDRYIADELLTRWGILEPSCGDDD